MDVHGFQRVVAYGPVETPFPRRFQADQAAALQGKNPRRQSLGLLWLEDDVAGQIDVIQIDILGQVRRFKAV